MDEISIIRMQRDELFNACKKVATDKKCPPWIAQILSNSVMKSMRIQREIINATTVKPVDVELSVGMTVMNSDIKDKCLYKIIKMGPVIQDVQLYDVQIVKGDANNPIGMTIYNVPRQKLKAVIAD